MLFGLVCVEWGPSEVASQQQTAYIQTAVNNDIQYTLNMQNKLINSTGFIIQCL